MGVANVLDRRKDIYEESTFCVAN